MEYSETSFNRGIIIKEIENIVCNDEEYLNETKEENSCFVSSSFTFPQTQRNPIIQSNNSFRTKDFDLPPVNTQDQLFKVTNYCFVQNMKRSTSKTIKFEDHRSCSVSKISENNSGKKLKFFSSEFTLKNNTLEYKSSSPPLSALKSIKKKEKEKLCCFYCKVDSSITWRRGPDGSRSLCNACGLRYYRLLLKEKNLMPSSTPNTIQSLLN